MLSTVGAFRVVQVEDLRSAMGQGEGRRGVDAGVRHLRESGLVNTVRLDGRARDVAVLTDAGRDLLEANRRDIEGGARQEFHAGVRRVGRAGMGSRSGLQKPRELSHDSRIYSAYLRTEARIRSDGGRVSRIVLDHELKGDYQRFLHEGNRERTDSTGRPQRTRDEAAKRFRAPRFHALYRTWEQGNTNALWNVGTSGLVDAFVALTRPYLYITHLVGTA